MTDSHSAPNPANSVAISTAGQDYARKGRCRIARWLLLAAVLMTLSVPVVAQAKGLAVGQWFSELLKEFKVLEQLDDPWVWFGFGAQGLFFLRFFWQWIVSEKHHRSTIPVAFWYFSLAGGLSLFVYAYHQRDLVIMSGQSVACLIYVRNLMLIYGRAHEREQAHLPREKLRSTVQNGGDSDE